MIKIGIGINKTWLGSFIQNSIHSFIHSFINEITNHTQTGKKRGGFDNTTKQRLAAFQKRKRKKVRVVCECVCVCVLLRTLDFWEKASFSAQIEIWREGGGGGEKRETERETERERDYLETQR